MEEKDIKKEVEEKVEEVVEEKGDAVADLVKSIADGVKAELAKEEKAETKTEETEVKKAIFDGKSADELDSVEKTAYFLRALYAMGKGDFSAHQKLQGLSEGTAANGGYLVPQEWDNTIVQNINDQTVVRGLATVISINTDTYHVVQNTSQPRVGWRSELAAKQTTTANWNEITLTPYSLAAIIVLSQELSDDASIGAARGIVQYLTDLVSEQLALEEDEAFLTGNGTGKPTGMTYTTTYTAIKTQAAGGLISGDHIVTAFYNIPAVDRRNAVWILSTNSLKNVAKLKDTTNQYLFSDALTAGGLPTLKGRPVYETDAMGSTILFGNIKAYYIADRTSRDGGRISVRVSDQAYVGSTSMFETNQVAIRVEERTDGELTRQQAVTLITGV